jgi:uncharacterized protein YdcH (DUF465 family)
VCISASEQDKENAAKNAKIEAELKKEKLNLKNEVKMLLLGKKLKDD